MAHLMKEVIRIHQRSSEVIRGHQRSSEVVRGHQRSSEVIRGHERSSEAMVAMAHLAVAGDEPLGAQGGLA